MRRCFALSLFVAGCASSAAPEVTKRNLDGVAVFERAEDDPGQLIVVDGVEWRGRFAVEADCLVLSIDDSDYVPVFINRQALQTALRDAGSGSPRQGATSWSLQGSRVSPSDQAGYSKVTGACGKPAFLVSGLSDPKPLPVARP